MTYCCVTVEPPPAPPQVETGVGVERPVLRREHGVTDVPGHLIDRDDHPVALLGHEPGELAAVGVGDQRNLVVHGVVGGRDGEERVPEQEGDDGDERGDPERGGQELQHASAVPGQAGEQRAPFVRMADRYAAVFLPATTVVALLAWAFSGDPVRALAVFVVATPCPLILAAPIALMSGLSRTARAGIVVKGGAALERLGAARTVLLDKTGTITLGHPELDRVVSLDGRPVTETLRLAASLDRFSAHPLAAALVAGAERQGVRLSTPEQVHEAFGHGIEGVVEGRRVVLGSARWLRSHGLDPALPAGLDTGAARVLVAIDGAPAGALLLEDRLREDAGELVPRLRSAGIRHIAIVSGDKAVVADRIGSQLGVDRVYSEQTPEQKVDVVRALRAQPELRNVVMVGDGVNDAPALALADVGIAMGTIGATISSDTADAVILVDRVDRVADAVTIGRRALAIARQSVLIGIGASLVAMGFAALGYLSPVAGALVQEAIDVGVILNALRALRG